MQNYFYKIRFLNIVNKSIESKNSDFDIKRVKKNHFSIIASFMQENQKLSLRLDCINIILALNETLNIYFYLPF